MGRQRTIIRKGHPSRHVCCFLQSHSVPIASIQFVKSQESLRKFRNQGVFEFLKMIPPELDANQKRMLIDVLERAYRVSPAERHIIHDEVEKNVRQGNHTAFGESMVICCHLSTQRKITLGALCGLQTAQ
ncbi:hypothetical protein TNCV_1848461 [Trichonephila clavipes]|nr:hypothetical protein TNCV_1848461 [Trichonephila clavipes]